MRIETNAKDGQEQKPTFFQWCKANKDKKTALIYPVEKVWIPNKYPDLTLETSAFRVRISRNSQAFKTLEDCLSGFIESDSLLAISEIDLLEYDYVIEVVESEKACWEPLGQFGYKVEVQDKPKSKSRVKQK